MEAKGYRYGWHFYQAGDADLVVSSDDDRDNSPDLTEGTFERG